MNKRILVIDDRPILTDLVKSILEEEGFEVQIRGIPFWNITEIEALDPDLIILAVTNIVDCIGRQTLKQRRQYSLYTPVLVLVREPEFILEQDQGLIDEHTMFVRSPFDIEVFLDQVQQALKMCNPLTQPNDKIWLSANANKAQYSLFFGVYYDGSVGLGSGFLFWYCWLMFQDVCRGYCICCCNGLYKKPFIACA